MSNIKRKVSFYRLSIQKFTEKHIERTTTLEYLSNEEIEDIFEEIVLRHMHPLNNGHYAIDVKTNSNKYVIEVINYNNNNKEKKIFAKIGVQNDSNTVALRDQNTFESEEVPMKDNQLLEVFTYFLIDFSTGVIAYIGMNGAPKISAIQSLFNNYCSNTSTTRTEAIISSITTNEILKTLNKRGTISKILISVAVPSDDVLSKVLGTYGKTYDGIRNVKSSSITYKIVASKNRNIFSSSKTLTDVIAGIKENFGDNLEGLKVNAKNGEEATQTYDLLQYNFTKTVLLDARDDLKLTERDFIEALSKTYEYSKDDLLEYIR